MTLIEALRSGKNFKRKNDEYFTVRCLPESGVPKDCKEFTRHDVLAEDWEIEDQKIVLTRDQVTSAFTYAITMERAPQDKRLDILLTMLGFKE